MSAVKPLLEVELTFRISVPIQGKDKLARQPNQIRSIRVHDDEEGTLEWTGICEHRLPLLSSSMSFFNDLTRCPMLSQNFAQDYVYTKIGGKVYFSFGPLIGGAYDGEGQVHITPSMFSKGSRTPLESIAQAVAPDGNAKDVATRANEFKKCALRCLALTATGPLESSAQVKADYQLLRIQRDRKTGNWDIGCHLYLRFYRYFLGEWVRVLPTPELPQPGGIPKHGLVIGLDRQDWAGDIEGRLKSELWASVKKLDSIIRSSNKKIVLIQGDPGSGKEVYSNAIHFGSVRPETGEDGLVQRSVANMNVKELRELLYGHMVNGLLLPGLIKKAEGGTLFLDEFDKIEDRNFYSELLRVLEASEYVPVDSPEVQKVDDVNWVFAGAFTGKAGSKRLSDLPPDFWSRLTTRLELPNLVRLGADNGSSYAGALFAYFFLVQAIKRAGSVHELNKPKTIAAGYAHALVFGEKYSASSPGKKPDPVNSLAVEFAQVIKHGRYWSCVVDGGKDDDDFGGDKRSRGLSVWTSEKPISSRVMLNGDWRTVKSMARAYDSARAIRMAAMAAFDYQMRKAMEEDETFWANPSEYLKKVSNKVAEVGGDAVTDARPGQECEVATRR